MKQGKHAFLRHVLLAFGLLFISFLDYIYRSLFSSSYNPLISLILILCVFSAFARISHMWFFKPYAKMLHKLDKYYKDMLGEAAASIDDDSALSLHNQVRNLEHLIDHFKFKQQQQSDLVCQLTSKNKMLDQNNKFANAIVQITSQILQSKDIHSILQLILDKAVDIIPNAQKGSILLVNENHLEYRAMYGYDMDALKDFKFELHEIFQNGAENLYEPIIINDVEAFNRKLNKERFDVLKETRSFELKSCISCAISLDNEFYGIINIDSVDSNYAFVDEHKPIIKYFAEQIGVALKNAQLIERILFLSQYDSLTKICNRAYFEEQLEKLHKESCRTKQGYTLVSIDMNDLKLVNDNFGHEAGDKLIIAFTDYIANMEQKPDLFARIGGDEFALIYINKTKAEVMNIMDAVRSHFAAEAFCYNGKYILNITFGCGVCSFPEGASDLTTLFKNADALMYYDKRLAKTTSQFND